MLIFEAVFLIPSLLIAIYYKQEDMYPFLFSIILISLIGLMMYNIKVENKAIKIREALIIASLGWILISLFGSLPFVLSKSIPSFVDALLKQFLDLQLLVLL